MHSHNTFLTTALLLAPALANPTKTHQRRQGAVSVPPGFTPGVKWQIEIQKPLDTAAAPIPTDARVWDIDLYHAQRHPNMIQYLHVRISSAHLVSSNSYIDMRQTGRQP